MEGGEIGTWSVGVDGEGGEERKDKVGEVGRSLEVLAGGELFRVDQDDPFLGHAGEQVLVEEFKLVVDHLEDALADRGHLLGGSEAGTVGDAGPGASHHGEASDADLEELVEV